MKVSKLKVLQSSTILSTLKLSKISDKEVRLFLIKIFLKLSPVAAKVREDQKTLALKLQEEWPDEFMKVSELRMAGKPVVGFEKFLEAESEINKVINLTFEEEVEFDFSPVQLDKFLDAVTDDVLNLESIGILTDCGILA